MSESQIIAEIGLRDILISYRIVRSVYGSDFSIRMSSLCANVLDIQSEEDTFVECVYTILQSRDSKYSKEVNDIVDHELRACIVYYMMSKPKMEAEIANLLA